MGRGRGKVVFAGTFNPWTVGHQSILQTALQVFDRVCVAVAENPNKPNMDYDFITWTLKPLESSRVYVERIKGLVAENADVLIRGVRPSDWDYEQNMAEWNREFGVPTVFFSSKGELSHINSTSVRYLHSIGKPVKQYFPNDLMYYRWTKGEIPKETLYAGKMGIGKSFYLKEKESLIIDGDTEVFHYVNIVQFMDAVRASHIMPEVELNRLMASDNTKASLVKGVFNFMLNTSNRNGFLRMVKLLGDCIAWEKFLRPGASYEVGPLGLYWDSIPASVLSNFRIVELTIDDETGKKRAYNRGVSKETKEFLDSIYVSPKIVDSRIELCQD